VCVSHKNKKVVFRVFLVVVVVGFVFQLPPEVLGCCF
jgi:hypothetical protein